MTQNSLDPKNVVIEFTLTAESADRFIALEPGAKWDPFSDIRQEEFTGWTGGWPKRRFRLMLHSFAEIDVFVQNTNPVNELVWDLVNPNTAEIVGHLKIWRRVAMSIAIRELIARMGRAADKGYTVKTTTDGDRNVATILDLGEI